MGGRALLAGELGGHMQLVSEARILTGSDLSLPPQGRRPQPNVLDPYF